MKLILTILILSNPYLTYTTEKKKINLSWDNATGKCKSGDSSIGLKHERRNGGIVVESLEQEFSIMHHSIRDLSDPLPSGVLSMLNIGDPTRTLRFSSQQPTYFAYSLLVLVARIWGNRNKGKMGIDSHLSFSWIDIP